MKKKLFALAIAAIAMTGTLAFAQTPDNSQDSRNNKMYTARTFTDYAFEGILLDIPQQQRIDSLNNAVRSAGPRAGKMCPGTACPDSAKVKGQRDGRKKMHAVTTRPDSAKMKGQRDGRKMRSMARKSAGVMPGVEYVAKVKEILTPEQFELFMTNVQAMPDNAVNNLMPAPQGKGGPNAATRGQHKKHGDRSKAKGGDCKNCTDKQCTQAAGADKQCVKQANCNDCQKGKPTLNKKGAKDKKKK